MTKRGAPYCLHAPGLRGRGKAVNSRLRGGQIDQLPVQLVSIRLYSIGASDIFV
jgi:hypothetical protein